MMIGRALECQENMIATLSIRTPTKQSIGWCEVFSSPPASDTKAELG